MRRPGREASVGEAAQGRRDVGLPWERRHRDGAMSDSREGGVTGTGGGRTSVTIPSGRVHTSALSVTEMPGTSHFPAPGGPFRAQIGGPETRCRPLVPYGGPKVDSASVCVGQHGRKRGVPDVSVTGSDLRHRSVPPPTHSRDAPVQVPPLSHTRPSRHGHSLPGPWREGRVPSPGDSLRAPIPSGRQLAGPRPFRYSSSQRRRSSVARRLVRGSGGPRGVPSRVRMGRMPRREEVRKRSSAWRRSLR